MDLFQVKNPTGVVGFENEHKQITPPGPLIW